MVTNRAEKIPKVLRRLAPLTFSISGPTSRRASACPKLNDGPKPPTWDTQLLSYWFSRNLVRRSSKISSWIWSIITGMVNVLRRPGLGASQVEKSPRLNWDTLFLTVAYDVACSPNVSVRMAWISFGALPGRGEKNLMTARVSMLLKSRASPDVLPFSFYNKKRLAIRHMNRPFFPTTLSIPSYDIGK